MVLRLFYYFYCKWYGKKSMSLRMKLNIHTGVVGIDRKSGTKKKIYKNKRHCFDLLLWLQWLFPCAVYYYTLFFALVRVYFRTYIILQMLAWRGIPFYTYWEKDGTFIHLCKKKAIYVGKYPSYVIFFIKICPSE